MMDGITNLAIEYANKILVVITPINTWWFFAIGLTIAILIVVGKRLSAAVKPDSPYLSNVVRAIAFCFYLVGCISIVAIFLVILTLAGLAFEGDAFPQLVSILKPLVLAITEGAITSLLVSLPLIWRLIPEWERGEGMTDADEILKKLRSLNNYDPLPYINLKKGCFIGKNYITNKPIYIPWAKINQSHMQTLGATSSGKNIEMLLIAYQCILVGQSVIWIDPKNDLRSPSAILQATEAVGKECHLIDLNPNQKAQFNLLLNCAEHEIEEIFVAGFDLRGKGSDGDFYRGKDEDAAMLAAKIAVTENATSVPELLQLCTKVAEITEQENFWRMFKKLASLEAINTKAGLDLEKSILNGDIIYVIGSCDNERVKMLQKMLLVRIMQIIKKRDRHNQTIPICVVLDEFKHLVSPTAINALAVVRDFNSHFLLAHQSMGDLEECPSVSKAAAYGAVVNNTGLKVLFKIDDLIHAKTMSELAGQLPIYIENSNKAVDCSSMEHQSTGSWSEGKDYRIPHQVITNLPMPPNRKKQAAVGVFYGLNDAQLFYVGHIVTDGEKPQIVSAEPFVSCTASKVNGGELI